MQFTITDTEYDNLIKWRKEHGKTCKWITGEQYAGAIGGVLTYSFTPTGLGIAIEVECTCGEKHNITDYGLW